jgi:transcriptional regulator with XRE-family HTH domain
MRTEQRGYRLAQIRKNTCLTQAQVAAVMGASQERV